MKIADSDSIKSGEKELLDMLKEHIDKAVVEKLAEERLKATKLACVGSDIIIHDEKIAYRFDFEIKAGVSLIFDRDGNALTEGGSPPVLVLPEEEEIPLIDPDTIEEEPIQLESSGGASVTDFMEGIKNEVEAELGQFEVPLNEEATSNNELGDILKRNRSFWEQKHTASEPEKVPSAENGSVENLNTILAKNREFWLSNSA